MRIPSGKIDQAIFFVALDSADRVTRETGLASFTVYRSRNGAAPVAFTTPTVVEIDAVNMPGVYSLLIDEDTTIASGSDSEEMVLHVTHAGMAPVTRTVELYRVDVLLTRVDGIEVGMTLQGALRIVLAAVAGKASGLGTATATYRGMSDDKDRIVATVDDEGNRTAVALDAT